MLIIVGKYFHLSNKVAQKVCLEDCCISEKSYWGGENGGKNWFNTFHSQHVQAEISGSCFLLETEEEQLHMSATPLSSMHVWWRTLSLNALEIVTLAGSHQNLGLTSNSNLGKLWDSDGIIAFGFKYRKTYRCCVCVPEDCLPPTAKHTHRGSEMDYFFKQRPPPCWYFTELRNLSKWNCCQCIFNPPNPRCYFYSFKIPFQILISQCKMWLQLIVITEKHAH